MEGEGASELKKPARPCVLSLTSRVRSISWLDERPTMRDTGNGKNTVSGNTLLGATSGIPRSNFLPSRSTDLTRKESLKRSDELELAEPDWAIVEAC